MKKQLDELVEKDLEMYPVWYFVGEEENSDDELTVMPATENEVDGDYALIIKCLFKTKNNKEYIGYLHWQAPFTIDALQPTLFIEEQEKIYFWKGMFPPKESYISNLKNIIGKDFFPLSFISQPLYRLKGLSGELNGFYFIGKDRTITLMEVN